MTVFSTMLFMFFADKLRDGGHKPVRIAPSGDTHCGDHHNRAHQWHHHRGGGRKVQDEAGWHWRRKCISVFILCTCSSTERHFLTSVGMALFRNHTSTHAVQVQSLCHSHRQRQWRSWWLCVPWTWRYCLFLLIRFRKQLLAANICIRELRPPPFSISMVPGRVLAPLQLVLSNRASDFFGTL